LQDLSSKDRTNHNPRVHTLPETNHKSDNPKYGLSNFGQVGPLVVFVLAFIMLGVYWIILSPIVDETILVHNNFDPTVVPLSQDRANAISLLSTSFDLYLVFVVIILVIWLLLQSLREREGGVY